MRLPSRRAVLRQAAALLSPGVLLGTACAKRPPRTTTFEGVCGVARRPEGDGITAQFLGTSSILFRDRETSILADGFVTRPSLPELGWKIRSNDALVESALKCFGVATIDAIFTGHSHYDHALDAPAFAMRAKSVLLGSESTRNIAIGAGFGGTVDVVRDGYRRPFGQFELTFIESAHSVPDLARGTVPKPLRTPAWERQFRSDTTWSVLMKHGTRTLLVHGSANYKFGALRTRRAQVVYLGVGSLGRQSPAFVDAYWDEVVGRTEPRRVFLVHWDNFFRGLDQPLTNMPKPIDDVDEAIERIKARAATDGVELVMPTAWVQVDPFAGLA